MLVMHSQQGLICCSNFISSKPMFLDLCVLQSWQRSQHASSGEGDDGMVEEGKQGGCGSVQNAGKQPQGGRCVGVEGSTEVNRSNGAGMYFE